MAYDPSKYYQILQNPYSNLGTIPTTGQQTAQAAQNYSNAYTGFKDATRNMPEWIYNKKNPAWQAEWEKQNLANQQRKEQQKAYQTELGTQGYSLKARPYEFDTSAYVNPFYSQDKSMLQGNLAARTAQGGAQINQSPQDYWRQGQMGLADYLTAQMTGQMPTQSQLQLQQGLNRNIANQMAMAATQRGNPALAMKGALGNIAQLGQQTAGQAGQMALQEAAQARGELANLYSGARQSDIGLATSQGQLDLESQKALDNMTQFYVSKGLDLDTAQWQARMELENQKAQQHTQAQQIQTQLPKGESKASKIMGGIGGALGGIASIFSDKNLKKNIENGDSVTKQFMDKLKSYTFKYKDNDEDELGVMAQDVEKSELGKTIVHKIMGKRAIDLGKATAASLASIANLNARMLKLEGSR